MATFYERIQELYEEARDRDYRIGRKKFAEIAGVRFAQMHGWLNKSGDPSTEDLKILSERLEVGIAWLVGKSSIRFETTKLIEIAKDLNKKELEDVVQFIEFIKCKRKRKKQDA